jgi:hypothetical protein
MAMEAAKANKPLLEKSKGWLLKENRKTKNDPNKKGFLKTAASLLHYRYTHD